MADSKLLFAWRNDDATRAASRQTAQVGWDEHQDWLSRTLASPDQIIRIVEEAGKPVGVVRADRAKDGWELSWTVAPEARERGVGKRMVKILAAGLEGTLKAVVRRGHEPSERIASSAGLTRVGSAEPDFDLWVRP